MASKTRHSKPQSTRPALPGQDAKPRPEVAAASASPCPPRQPTTDNRPVPSVDTDIKGAVRLARRFVGNHLGAPLLEVDLAFERVEQTIGAARATSMAGHTALAELSDSVLHLHQAVESFAVDGPQLPAEIPADDDEEPAAPALFSEAPALFELVMGIGIDLEAFAQRLEGAAMDATGIGKRPAGESAGDVYLIRSLAARFAKVNEHAQDAERQFMSRHRGGAPALDRLEEALVDIGNIPTVLAHAAADVEAGRAEATVELLYICQRAAERLASEIEASLNFRVALRPPSSAPIPPRSDNRPAKAKKAS